MNLDLLIIKIEFSCSITLFNLLSNLSLYSLKLSMISEFSLDSIISNKVFKNSE